MVMSCSEVNMGIFCCAGDVDAEPRVPSIWGVDPHSSGLCHCERSPANGTSLTGVSVWKTPHSSILSPRSLLHLATHSTWECRLWRIRRRCFFFVLAAGWVVREEEEEAQNKRCYKSFLIQKVTAVFEYIWLPRSLSQCFLIITWS